VGPGIGGVLDLVVRPGCVCCGERVGLRRRWGKAWGPPLRECSWVGHHQGPEGAGMRPLIGIGRDGLCHRG